ncbi:MAG TPA: PAS domain-containing protein, partial [Methylomirabilota bacterium]|nr:PAS domain-containing protein [Methylomirabilota bacterium]
MPASASSNEEARRRYELVIASLKEVVFQTDSQGVWTFLNAAWTEVTGLSVSESLNTSYLNYLHPADRMAHWEAFNSLIEEGKDHLRHDARLRHRNGRYRWVELFARTVRDDSGKVVGTAGTINDVTEGRVAQQRAVSLSRLARALLSADAIETAARLILRTAEELLKWDAAHLSLCSEDSPGFNTILRVDTTDGEHREVPGDRDEWQPDGVWLKALREGPQLILRNPAGIENAEARPIGDKKLHSASWMIVPIRNGQRVTGLLSLQSHDHNAFDQEDIELAGALADHCGGALERLKAEAGRQR